MLCEGGKEIHNFVNLSKNYLGNKLLQCSKAREYLVHSVLFTLCPKDTHFPHFTNFCSNFFPPPLYWQQNRKSPPQTHRPTLLAVAFKPTDRFPSLFVVRWLYDFANHCRRDIKKDHNGIGITNMFLGVQINRKIERTEDRSWTTRVDCISQHFHCYNEQSGEFASKLAELNTLLLLHVVKYVLRCKRKIYNTFNVLQNFHLVFISKFH